MIVGTGLIARAFSPLYADDEATIVFASGVSNSAETSDAAFARERDLVLHHIARKPERLVYFGSCNVANPNQKSAYFEHKRSMERLVGDAAFGLVIRLPQVVGATNNPNTLTNHLAHQIMTGQMVKLWTRARRNLIDIDDVVAITHHILANASAFPRRVSVASPWTLSMREILEIFESVLGRRAEAIEIDRGDDMHIDASLSEQIATDIGLDFGKDYPYRVVEKYYGGSR